MRFIFKILLGICFFCIPYLSHAAWQAPAGNPYSGNNSFPFISSVGNDNVYVLNKPLGIDDNFKVGANTLFANESTGRIGVLTDDPQTTLDVWGVMRIGQMNQSSFPVCNSLLEGTMIYNLGQNRLNICVDDAWRRIGYDGDLDHWLDYVDCNDSDPLFNPGVPEICGDTIDENCDGSFTLGCSVCYRDADNDGYGNPSIFEYMNTCPGTGAYVANNTDCDDGQYWTNPGGLETCDENDNNCRNGVDEGCDDDNDNYCDSGMKIFGGTPTICPLTFFTGDDMNGDDCNDSLSAIKPSASEICDNTVDENCDGSLTLGCSTCYRDADNDSYGNASVTKFYNTCPGPGLYVANNTDCNDANVNIKPGALETCDNTDNNCTNGTDEGCDDDNDNYCDSAMKVYNAPVSTCSSTVVANGANGDDCNDELASLNPGSEICGDTVTNDCDSLVNENCSCAVGDWGAAVCPSMSTCTANITAYGTKLTNCVDTSNRPSVFCPCTCRTDSWATIYCPECGTNRTIFADLKTGYSCTDTNNTRTSKFCAASSCPATSFSGNFCYDGDVYRNVTSYACSSGDCNSSTSRQKVTECGSTKTCSGGACIDAPCPTSPCSALQSCCLSRGGTYLPPECYSESSCVGCRCMIVTRP